MSDLTRRQVLRSILGVVGAGAVVSAGSRWFSSSSATTAISATRATTATTTAISATRATTSPSPGASSGPSPTFVESTLSGVSVSVLCRDAWGALPSGDGLKAHTISRLTVHHTARFLSSPKDTPTAVRRHQRFHIEERGWPDLAYHYVISSDGYAFEGRPEAFRGDTSTSYDPTGHYLVCLEGEFDTQSPSPEQLETLARLLAYGAGKYAVDVSMIGGHRDFAATACPGANLYEDIADGSLRQRVSDLLTGGGVVLDRVCGAVGIETVAQIEA